MLLVLMLMVRDRNGYRETESHLKNNPNLLRKLALEKAPSKSSIHSAASRIGLDTLANINDAIVARFKKSWKTSKEARGHRLLRPWHQAEEQMVLDQDPLLAVEEERLP
jgi:hypothetical protein